MDKDIEKIFDEAPFRFDNASWLSYCDKVGLSLSFPAIHVSGSNGKSSVCALLEAIYISAGYKVGALFDFNNVGPYKAIRMNGSPIKESDFCAIFEQNKKLFAKYSLSSYEMGVAIAYLYFSSSKPDLVIIESAFGGAYDATNIDELNDVLCIVTSSGLAHTSLLGTTTSEIALNHALILKDECPLLVGKLDENSASALSDFAKKHGSKYQMVDDYHLAHLVDQNYHFDFGEYKDLAISTPSLAYLGDASIALQALSILSSSFPVKEENIRAGLLAFDLPCRSESDEDLLFDVASNPEAIKTFLLGLNALSKGKPVHVLFAASRFSNIASMLPLLGNVVASINLTTYPSPHARTEEDYFLYVSDYPFIEDPLLGVKGLREKFPEEKILLIGDNEFVMFMRNKLA